MSEATMMSDAAEAVPAASFTARMRRPGTRWLREFSLLPAMALLILIGFIESPDFLTSDNFLGMLQQSTELSLLVLAEALILIGGRMDLSLESTVTLAPVIAMWLVLPTAGGRFNGLGLAGAWLAIPVCLLVGAVVGAVNGFLILKMNLNGFVVTLGMLTMLHGLVIVIDGGQTITTIPSSFAYLGHTEWLGLAASVWVCGALFAIGIAALGWYRHGRALYAIGGNPGAARAAGIRVDRTMWTVLIIGSMLAAFAGVLYTGRLGSASASVGTGKIFEVFAATVIGGVSMNGGRGSLFGALTGVLTLKLIENVLVFGHVSPNDIEFFNGVVILVALIVSRYTSGAAQD
jgi:simple sugar transport system permease protein